MNNKLKVIINTAEEQEILDLRLETLGIDKCREYIKNYLSITGKTVVTVQEFYDYTNYEYELSTVLFGILRIQEDYVKGFLSNHFHGIKLDVEERKSNYSKVKYYLKFPNELNGDYIDIRTFSFTKGPVSYYNAIKTLDFGDVNLLFSHLNKESIKNFSDNNNIVKELDYTRQIRNYVYHHNILFSFGKKTLKTAILFLLKNINNKDLKQYYIDAIHYLRYHGADREHDIGETIAIEFSPEEINKIMS